MSVCVLPSKSVTFLGPKESWVRRKIMKSLKNNKQADLSEARPTFLPFQFPRFPGLAQLALVSPTQRPGPPTHLSPLCLQGEGPLPQIR